MGNEQKVGESSSNPERTETESIELDSNKQEAAIRGTSDREDTSLVGTSENSKNQVVICVDEENEESEAKKLRTKMSELENSSCLIDVSYKSGKGFGENRDGEREYWICRICLLSSDQSEGVIMNAELIELGCGCKDELGIAHVHCAAAWFNIKGNRLCEICGEIAKNVTRAGNNRFMEQWNEGRSDINGISSSDANGNVGGCWRGQPFCNFLLACLVVAFVLPWFFRINMF